MGYELTVSGTSEYTLSLADHNHDARYGWDPTASGFTDLTVTDNLNVGRINEDTWYVPASAGQSGIQAALSSAASGDVILLGPGTFTITAQLSIPAGVCLSGAGRTATVLQSSVDGYTISASGNGVVVRDLSVCVSVTATSSTAAIRFGTSSSTIGGCRVRNVEATVTSDGTGGVLAVSAQNAELIIEDSILTTTTTGTPAFNYAVYSYVSGSPPSAPLPSYVRRSVIKAIHNGGGSPAVYGIYSRNLVGDSCPHTIYVEPACYCEASGSGSGTFAAIVGSGSGDTVYARGTHVYGKTYDLYQAGGAAFYACAPVLYGGTSTGTITHQGRIRASNAIFSGGLGVFNTTPPTSRQTYTVTNVTTDRSYDANATTIDELADVLGTLINDLRAYGFVA